ncbi:MAG: Mce protein [Mycobacterium sp.]
MAEDTKEPETADAAEELSESTAADDHDVDDAEQPTKAEETTEGKAGLKNRLARLRRRASPRLSRTGRALVAGALVVAALTGLTGWLGYQAYQKHEAQAQRDLFIQVARQGAVNLTTINYTEVDVDVQRILDLATGAFREDFEQRSKPFIEVVKAAQSKSEGTVTDAGLESQRGDSAQVLVAVAVKSRTAGGEEAPREWRMRIQVRSVGDDAKVSNVVFVP